MRRRLLPVIWTTLKSTTCAGDVGVVAEGTAIDGIIAAGIMPGDAIVAIAGTGVTICAGIADVITPTVLTHPAVKRRPI
jgi:hypothetical protein